MRNKEFTQILYPRRELVVGMGVYRVYKTPKEFVTVEAENVSDAITKSEIPVPVKVVRAASEIGYLIQSGYIAEAKDDIAHVAEGVAENVESATSSDNVSQQAETQVPDGQEVAAQASSEARTAGEQSPEQESTPEQEAT